MAMTEDASRSWFFLSDHGTVLLSLAGDPMIELSAVAQRVGASERAVQQIIEDLVAEGYVVRNQEPRTRYDINRKAHLRHPLFEDVEIGPLIDALQGDTGNRTTAIRSRDSGSARDR